VEPAPPDAELFAFLDRLEKVRVTGPTEEHRLRLATLGVDRSPLAGALRALRR
jgi:hypothetical protein